MRNGGGLECDTLLSQNSSVKSLSEKKTVSKHCLAKYSSFLLGKSQVTPLFSRQSTKEFYLKIRHEVKEKIFEKYT